PAPKTVEHAGPEALQHHVRVAREAQEGLAARAGLEVEADRALAPVEREIERGAGAEVVVLVVRVVGRRPADVIARVRVLDLDHGRPGVGEEQRAEAAREQARQVEEADAFERAAHAAAPAVSARVRPPRPSSSRASATLATRRPTSSAICRALA